MPGMLALAILYPKSRLSIQYGWIRFEGPNNCNVRTRYQIRYFHAVIRGLLFLRVRRGREENIASLSLNVCFIDDSGYSNWMIP